MRWREHELPEPVEITSPPKQRPLSDLLTEQGLEDFALHARYYEGLIAGLTARLEGRDEV